MLPFEPCMVEQTQDPIKQFLFFQKYTTKGGMQIIGWSLCAAPHTDTVLVKTKELHFHLNFLISLINIE